MGGYSLTTKMFSSKCVVLGLLYILCYANTEVGVNVEIWPTKLSALSGASVSFKCSYQSTINYTDVHLTWMKNGKYIIKSDIINGTYKEPKLRTKFRSRVKFIKPGTFKLTYLNARDKGTYYCKIRLRKYGAKSSYVKGLALCKLNIVERPQLTVKTRDMKIFSNTSKVVLEVEMSKTTLQAMVDWLHNGKPILYHHGLKEKMDNNSLYLNFGGMSKEDKEKSLGEYTAVAHNEIGINADKVTLYKEDFQDGRAPVQRQDFGQSVFRECKLPRDNLDIMNVSVSLSNHSGGIIAETRFVGKTKNRFIIRQNINQYNRTYSCQVMVRDETNTTVEPAIPKQIYKDPYLTVILVAVLFIAFNLVILNIFICRHLFKKDTLNQKGNNLHSTQKSNSQEMLKIGNERQKLLLFEKGQLICYGKDIKKQLLIGKICSIGETLTVIKYDGSLTGPWKPRIKRGEPFTEQVDFDSVCIKVTLTKSNCLKPECRKSLLSNFK